MEARLLQSIQVSPVAPRTSGTLQKAPRTLTGMRWKVRELRGVTMESAVNPLLIRNVRT